eukprot:scaffold12676_cov112-Isochrysis_galbana.AAC.3
MHEGCPVVRNREPPKGMAPGERMIERRRRAARPPLEHRAEKRSARADELRGRGGLVKELAGELCQSMLLHVPPSGDRRRSFQGTARPATGRMRLANCGIGSLRLALMAERSRGRLRCAHACSNAVGWDPSCDRPCRRMLCWRAEDESNGV